MEPYATTAWHWSEEIVQGYTKFINSLDISYGQIRLHRKRAGTIVLMEEKLHYKSHGSSTCP